MSEGAREVSHDFWRPAQAPRPGAEAAFPVPCCADCGTEFAIGARFCHVCGSRREPLLREHSRLAQWIEPERVREALELSWPCLILLAAAAVCALGALLTGVIFRSGTLLEWQAVQAWRMQWMLAAIVALLAALLLKKPAA